MPQSVGLRVKARRKELNMSQKELAEKAQITQPTISALERGESQTSGSLAKIAAALNVSALWLETGLGDKEVPSTNVQAFQRTYPQGREPEPEYEIRLLEAKGSCGNGRYSFSNNVADEFKAPIIKDQRWLMRFNVRPEHAFAISADGFSMANFIMHGDLVYFTDSVDQLKSGMIYLIDTPDGLRIKRVHKRADGHVVLSSDNPDKTIYPDETYTPQEAENIIIKGRFICREG